MTFMILLVGACAGDPTTVPCNSSAQCPVGQVCSKGTCQDRAEPGADANVHDLAPVDRGARDATGDRPPGDRRTDAIHTIDASPMDSGADVGPGDTATADHRAHGDSGSLDAGRDARTFDLGADRGPADIEADHAAMDRTTDLRWTDAGTDGPAADVIEDHTAQDTFTNLCGNLELDEGEACDDGGDSPLCTANCTAKPRLAAGYEHTCMLLDDLTVKCWGTNSYGQLGLGDTDHRGDAPGEMGSTLPRVDLGSVSVVAIAAGQWHSCAILQGGVVKCWGRNHSGQLGQGNTKDRGDDPDEMLTLEATDLGSGRTAIAISAGAEHNCAILDNGKVKCWGCNWAGRLGLGDMAYRGDSTGEMGDNLPEVDLGTDYQALDITSGAAHNCALLPGGAVKCWGQDPGEGRLGIGETGNRGDQETDMGENLPAVDLGRPAVAVASAWYHSCALLDDAKVKCWGGNGKGQLGLGDTGNRGDEPGEMALVPTVDLGIDGITSGLHVVSVDTGGQHSCALLNDGTLRCWGGNNYGQLGLGNGSQPWGDAVNEMGVALPDVALGSGRVAALVNVGGDSAQSHSCAYFVDGAVKCWGNNNSGRLGLGDATHRGTSPDHMGDALPVVDLGP